jgi:two-component system LytT family sensor kinase
MSGQLEAGPDLPAGPARRAHISPHFTFNALTAITWFVRTDPERANDLLHEFADLSRYVFRGRGDLATLADELRSLDRYVLLEQARFPGRISVTREIAPELLPVAVPFLCLQPLMENAVRNAVERKAGPARIAIVAADLGADVLLSVEDDGVGMEPASGATGESDSGLHNVDERLRQLFGDAYGLVIETTPGAGTRVSMRVPNRPAGAVSP